MNRILYSKNGQKTKVILIILLILLLLILGFFGLGIFKQNSNRIFSGVKINAIDVGDMTIEEASLTLADYQKLIDSKNYVFSYGNREVSVSGEELGLEFVKGLVEKAYSHGRSGNVMENTIDSWKSFFNNEHVVEADYTLDEDSLNEKLAVLLEEEKEVAKNDYYEISGDKILVTKGYDGVVVKTDSVKQSIIDAAGSAESKINLEVETNVEKAERLDFNKIYEEVYVEKKNASCEQNENGTVEYIKEIIGVSFDKDAAETEYLNLANGESMKIAIIKEKPEITTANLDNVLFGEILATYKTTYNASNKDRSTNLEVAARNMNGTILLPGEEFSYNKVVGQRTYANGFKDAHIFSGGKVVDGLGGGICQISSTLYNAILKVDGIEITERKNHMLYPEYVEPSLDATVVWGSIDFRFKNNRETPIKIVSSVKNGTATTTIYGKKAKNEPIIELQSVIEKTIPYTTVTEYDDKMYEDETVVTQTPVNGYVSKAYKIVKDSTGKQISKTLISSDTYKQTSKIMTVGTKKRPVEIVQPVVPETPSDNNGTSNNQGSVTENPDNTNNESSNDWPTGWDTPENPYYTGN
ncbi:MAG: VanW family protein [Clostridia bacterium]|nr:VanW family protein [Clostridia bacterium]